MKVFNVPCAGGRGIFGKIGSSSTHFAAGLTMTSFARCLPLLLLLLGAPVALGGESCPQPSEGTACQTIYDPVTCNGCDYENSCEAEAAGQTNCSPACPVPAADAVCTREYNLTLCGGFRWCLYDNPCLANAAGQTEADCTRSCPQPPAATACTADYSPQFCGGCFYSNLCEATAAWEAAGLSADICVDISEYVNSTTTSDAATETTCPPIVVPTMCPSTFDPVTCDGDCYYNNECLANEAGATNCQATCDAPPDNDCGNENEAFICRNGCTYRNGCLAEAAGFTPSSDCAPVCRFNLENLDVVCPAIYSPVFCLGCTFDNECIAGAVGFNVDLDCQSIASSAFVKGTAPTAAGDSPPTSAPAPTSGTFSFSLVVAVLAGVMSMSVWLS